MPSGYAAAVTRDGSHRGVNAVGGKRANDIRNLGCVDPALGKPFREIPRRYEVRGLESPGV